MPASREALVHVDQAVMGGRPVFVGTHVPIDIVLAAIDVGDACARLQPAYPFLTREHITAAKQWIELNGLPPRTRLSSTQIASGSDSMAATTASSPLLLHEALLDATRRRVSRKSTQRPEPNLRCEIQVDDGSEENIVGVVSLLERRAGTVDVWCGWHRTDGPSFPTLLHVPERASPWDQLFLFVLMLTGEFALEAFPSLAAGRWHTASLEMPDVDATDVERNVTVTVDAGSWTAVLASSTARQAAELMVPEELRQQNIGILLLEMASRLLFGKSGWEYDNLPALRVHSPVLTLPEILMEEPPAHLPVVLRPAFDRLWQSWGYPRSLSFRSPNGQLTWQREPAA